MDTSGPTLAERLRPLVQPPVGLVDEPVELGFPAGVAPMPVTVAQLSDLAAVLPGIAAYSRRTLRPGTGMDGAGGGFDPEHARWVAVAEALERYCSVTFDPAGMRWATAAELGADALDLSTLPRLSRRERELPGQSVAPPDPAVPRHWVRGVRLSDGRPTWLPALLVYLFYVAQRPEENLANPISTGCAAHSDPVTALVRGLMEIVERDASAIVWRQRLALPEIEVDTGPPELHRLLGTYARHRDVDLRLFDATTDVGVPSVYAVRVDRRSVHLRHVVACASDLDPVTAAGKAVREVLSCHLALLGGTAVAPARAEDCFDTMDGALFDAHADQAPAFDFLLRPDPPRRPLSRLPSAPPEPAAALRWLVGRLAAVGSDCFAVDLTTDEARSVGMTVVRTVAPGLQPMSFVHTAQFLGHPRLYAAPAAMGHPVLAEADLNPWPQPIA